MTRQWCVYIFIIHLHLLIKTLYTCPDFPLTRGGSGLDINQCPHGHDTLFGITLTTYGYNHSITTPLFLTTIGRLILHPFSAIGVLEAQ